MTQDPEASWPLTQTDPGYFPGVNPMPAPPSNVMPYSTPQYPPVKPAAPVYRPISQGVRIAMLAIILGTAVPLTAIAAINLGLVGLAVCWVGIAFVAAVVFRNR